MREGEQHVAHITLGVDRNDRDVVEGSLLENADPKASLAGTRHTDDDGVSRQVFCVVKNQLFGELVGFCVKTLTEIESAEFFKVLHIVLLGIGVACIKAEWEADGVVNQQEYRPRDEKPY